MQPPINANTRRYTPISIKNLHPLGMKLLVTRRLIYFNLSVRGLGAGFDRRVSAYPSSGY